MDSLERLRPERELVIVYAGPRGAGKSTNLKALARRQGQTFERSLCLERGALRGVALRWRVEIAAEGAAGERALAEADGVVYVCRSRADELAGLRALLATYAERPALERPPIVVQANMQDVAGALGPRAVLEAAGAPLLVIPAIASEGRGVESTLRVLIHECTERLRARFATPATGVPAAARRPRTSTPALGVPAVPTTAERAPAVKVFQEEDTSAAKVATEGGEGVARRAPRPRLTAIAGARGRVGSSGGVRRTAGLRALLEATPPATELWPLPRARALLRDLQLEARRDEHESSDMYGWRWGLDRDQGDAWVALVGPWCVASGVDDRFADRDAAREALHARARALARRARLGPRSVVLAIASADDDARLWTLYPRLPGLDAELRSRGRGPSAARDALVDALAEFVARLLAAAPSEARLCPDRLALEEGRVVALPDVLGDADRERPLGVALLLLAERLGDAAAVDRLAERLRALAPPLLATLRSSLAAAAPADDGALAARLRERLGVASPRLVTMSR